MTAKKPARVPTFTEAVENPKLLGALPEFKDLTTWRPWLAFWKAVEGRPLNAEELALFQKHTGRKDVRRDESGKPQPFKVACAQVGRQSGKTFTTSAAVAWYALVQKQRGLYIPILSQDQRSVQRTTLGYVRRFIEAVPAFKSEVASETTESITLKNGTVVATYPGNRPDAIRGIRAPLLHLDEAAWFITSDGRPTDVLAFRAAQSCLALQQDEPGGGTLVITSSPYLQEGLLATLASKAYANETSPILFWKATGPEMNPRLLEGEYVERMREIDPVAFQAEVLGEFQAGAATLFDYEALERCVDYGRRENAPVLKNGPRYYGFVDPSGFRSDAGACAISSREGEDVVIHALRSWPGDTSSEVFAEECAQFLHYYGLTRAVSDRYSGAWSQEAFTRHGVRLEQSAEDKSTLYINLLALVNSQRVALIDHPVMLAEAHRLERRGRKVDHRSGQHDDHINAVAGAAYLAGVTPKPKFAFC